LKSPPTILAALFLAASLAPCYPDGPGLIITEFLAANNSGLIDEDEDSSDWIEIHNTSQEPISLEGWHLTDERDNLAKWQFPNITVESLGYVLVFASGKNRSNPKTELHTNFKLNRNGDYLAFVQPDKKTIATEFSPQYPAQINDVSYGQSMDLEIHPYLTAESKGKMHFRTSALAASHWIQPGFEDENWEAATTAVGYIKKDHSVPIASLVPTDDITKPGDDIIPTSTRSPVGETVKNAIDNDVKTKYLNFDKLNAGMTVEPESEQSVVTGLLLTSANDAPQRDPASFVLYGSNNGIGFSVIAKDKIDAFPDRFSSQEIHFPNDQTFRLYRLIFPTIRNAGSAVAMQIAEVQFMGKADHLVKDSTLADVTHSSDLIIPTSHRSPSNETVENAIDNNPKTKYLNFDKVNTGLTITTTEGVVTGLALTSANDAPDRDPAKFVLSGSNDDGVTFTKIASGNVPEFQERFDRQTVSFDNDVAYKTYELIFPMTVGPSGCCMQISEVEFLGVSGPSSSDFEDLILTNVETDMYGRTAILDLRFPFTVKAGDPSDYLSLNVRYSGGFLAYLNGVLVAQSNAPENPDFPSTNILKRPRKDVLAWESFGINAKQIRKGRNLLAIRALNDSADSLEFLFQAQLENTRESLGTTSYFSSPTPGCQNGEPSPGLVATPEADHEHGFYETPFKLALSSITEGASIRYTTDGSNPTLATGETYTAPIPIDHTTILRSTAFHKNWLPSRTLTQTYVFPEDTIRQTSISAKNSGFPKRWDNQTADYDLDQRVTGLNGKDRYRGKYTRRLKESLQSLPSISIVMDIGDLFGPRGIYSNPERRGATWERPASVEMIHPDKSQGFQENVGIRIQGGAFREMQSRLLTLKKSFRLIFRSKYGASQLDYPLFGPEVESGFNNIVLRANGNDAWTFAGTKALYIRDTFAMKTARDMGMAAPNSTFVHLYLNGLYWGLYNPVERPDAGFSEKYHGGKKEDWDALNQDSAPDGNRDAWNRMLNILNGNSSSNEVYQRLQGNNLDGTANPQFESLLNMENMIDYMILNFYVGNGDWPGRNHWVGRNRNNGDGFYFYPWDTETALGLGSGLGTNRLNASGAVASPYAALRNNAAFRLLFADRIHRHFFRGGALYVNPDSPQWNPASPESNRPATRFAKLVDQVKDAMIGESTRWGDQLKNSPFTPDEHWKPEKDDLLKNYFPNRSRIVLGQFQKAGLYPSVKAPVLNLTGGTEDGFQLKINAPKGNVFFTFDGNDPRGPTGKKYDGPVVLNNLTTVKARTLYNSKWSALAEATLLSGNPTLLITELHYHPAQPSSDEIKAGFNNANDFEFMEIHNAGMSTIDLHGVRFTDGIQFGFTTSPIKKILGGHFFLLVKNRKAFEKRYGSGLPIAGEYSGQLANNGERIEAVNGSGDTILELNYGTKDPWPEEADGRGSSMEIIDPNNTFSRPENWRTSLHQGGSPGHPGNINQIIIKRLDIKKKGELNLVFSAPVGGGYTVLYRESLSKGDWSPLRKVETTSLTKTEIEVQVGIPNETETCFFKIISEEN
tara:strand:- start:93 stop:4718 length:4626 start_codon:yes stop_codon:yes gene_type:complete